MRPIISVIVPIYKVENYLKECIDSILQQTFNAFELILVDDGSPDNCGNICDDYAKKDKRIIVLHKTNGGLSDARNFGLSVAKGDYISFIDSDDAVDPSFLQVLYDSAVINSCDISACHFFKFIEREEIIITRENRSTILNNDDYWFYQTDKYSWNDAVAWNKLYKRELFNNISYPKGRIHEDEFVIHRLVEAANKICVNSSNLYFYRIRTDSIMNLQNLKSSFDKMDALTDRLMFFISQEKNEKILCFCLNACFRQFEKIKKNINLKKELNNKKKIIKKLYLSCKSKIKFKHRLLMNIYFINSNFYFYLRNKRK